jgi:hypothetical protein
MQQTNKQEAGCICGVNKVNMTSSLMAQWYGLTDKNEPSAVILASEICRNLRKEKHFALLEMLLKALPENDTYSKNEQIVRAKISVAYQSKRFQLVYELIQVG